MPRDSNNLFGFIFFAFIFLCFRSRGGRGLMKDQEAGFGEVWESGEPGANRDVAYCTLRSKYGLLPVACRLWHVR